MRCVIQDKGDGFDLWGLQVVDVLQRIGRVADAPARVRPIQACAEPWRYRNKMTFAFSPRTWTPRRQVGSSFLALP